VGGSLVSTLTWGDDGCLAGTVGMRHVEGVMAKSDKTKTAQRFTIKAPAANSVHVVGDFTHWQKAPISLKKEDSGMWSGSVELAPGTYHYRFLVDGEWRDDPECTLRVNNPYGSQNSVRQVT
jgi:1,4-alpha-glucan branching enzyme